MSVVLWMLLLVAQNACFTWVSRARNSGSDWYHAVASVFSNGVWFAAFFFTFDFLERMREGTWAFRLGVALAYVTATVFGSVFAGRFLRRYVERGSRRVGHYERRDAK